MLHSIDRDQIKEQMDKFHIPGISLGLLAGGLEDIGGALYKTGGVETGYEIVSVTPFDMFPQTKWCETLVVLSHKKPDGHINVKVEFGE